jgi:DNA invertase Pin-like site-specific DNA recombinase
MVAYAYLRVSTDHQDLDNQRHGILEYANTHAINHLKFVEDKISGRLKWRSGKKKRIISQNRSP